MTKREASDAIRAAMTERGLSFAELATQLGRPRVWVAAAALGQHPFSREETEKLVATLGLPAEAVAALEEIPTRGGLDAAVPVDPDDLPSV
jgi:cyanate lyase